MNCIFCQTVLPPDEKPEIVDWCDHWFEKPTCLNCQTEECELEFNLQRWKNGLPDVLIGYQLKWNGYIAMVGIERQWCEIWQEWRARDYGTTQILTWGGTIYRSDTVSPHLTPSNFPNRLKTMLVFS